MKTAFHRLFEDDLEKKAIECFRSTLRFSLYDWSLTRSKTSRLYSTLAARQAKKVVLLVPYSS